MEVLKFFFFFFARPRKSGKKNSLYLLSSFSRCFSLSLQTHSPPRQVMDSNDLERERGITILSKNTAVRYGKTKINIIDTPGHADFGGEVERVLNMCDGVLLLVDSVEGPMPQTRFVLRKALALDKKVVVVVNKVDRPAARVDWVVDATFDLFCDLCASDEQCDFPVVYASGQAGVAGASPTELADDLQPLFDAIIREVSPPRVRSGDDAPLQLLVTNLDYDEHKGRIAIGRVTSGTLSRGKRVLKEWREREGEKKERREKERMRTSKTNSHSLSKNSKKLPPQARPSPSASPGTRAASARSPRRSSTTTSRASPRTPSR